MKTLYLMLIALASLHLITDNALSTTPSATGQFIDEDSTWQKSSQTQIATDETHSVYRPSTSDQTALPSGLRMTVSLLMVLALIAIGVLIMKKITPYKGLNSNVKHPVTVLSKVSLGQKKSICLVRIADEILVVGMTNTNISLLSKMDTDDYYKESNESIYEVPEMGYKQGFRKLYSALVQLKKKSSSRTG